MKLPPIFFLFAAMAGISLGEVPQTAPETKETPKPPEAPPVSPERAAVEANDRAYEAAYAKGDVEALAAFFQDDAEYTSDDGRTFSGKEAIEACLRDTVRENKGATIAIKVDTVKVLSPEVIVEKGTTLVTTKPGDELEAFYTAVHVKKDGKWKISQLIETPMPDADPNVKLSELSWLVGDWEDADEDANLTVRSHYQWARGGSFITRSVTVKRGDDSVLEGWQIIGWDPVAGNIRSWTFDDAGGYSEGTWSREGQRWLVRDAGYSPEGSRTSADQTITKLDGNRFFWESGNRTLDGDPLPGIGRIEIHRVKGTETSQKPPTPEKAKTAVRTKGGKP